LRAGVSGGDGSQEEGSRVGHTGRLLERGADPWEQKKKADEILVLLSFF
jgi:hypothetical protein